MTNFQIEFQIYWARKMERQLEVSEVVLAAFRDMSMVVRLITWFYESQSSVP